MTIRSVTFGASARLVDLAAADYQRAERGTRFEKPLLLKNNHGNHQRSPLEANAARDARLLAAPTYRGG